METFSFSPRINLSGERKWLLAVASFEATKFVFNIFEENNSFSITSPERWMPKVVRKLLLKSMKY